MQAAGEGGQADPRLGQGEDGAFGGDNDVAGQGDFEPAAHGHAVDRRDQGLVQVEPRGQAGKARRRAAHFPARRLMLQVIAGGKGPLSSAGDDAHPLLGIRRKGVQSLMHLEVGRRVQGVHHVRPVERDDGDVTLTVDADVFVGHGPAPWSFSVQKAGSGPSGQPLWRRLVR